MAHVLLLCQEVLGESMAGPAIRYWEFAKALSQKHAVILMAPNASDLKAEDFVLKPHYHKVPKPEVRWADVIISQTLSYKLALAAKQEGTKLILDAYDPEPLEHLEIFRDHPMEQRAWDIKSITASCSFALSMADAVICANDQQQDLWTGILMRQGRLTPHLYDKDVKLKNLIDIVPFGLSSTPPRRSGPGLRERFNLAPSDHVLLWGGGIWNWFDPLTLIHAVHQLSMKRKDIHLVFMGIKHPNPVVPEMKMARDALELAKSLGIMDKHVFANMGWLPYGDRQNFLLDATIGTSSHFDNLETRYAFRTRILDYIWAGLPILTTEGDSFAALVKKRDLGCVVPYQNAEATAQAIESMVDNPQRLQAIRENLAELRPEFLWENTTKPILRMIEHLQEQPRGSLTFRDAGRIGKFLARKVWLKLCKP